MQNQNEIKWDKDTQLNSQVSKELWIPLFLFLFLKEIEKELLQSYLIYIYYYYFDGRAI